MSWPDKLIGSECETISGIKLVLGADYSYCNPIKTEIFGRNNDCTLLMSPSGIMLEGDIDKLIDNVEYIGSVF